MNRQKEGFLLIIFAAVFASFPASAYLVRLEGDGGVATTGEQLENVEAQWSTNAVLEPGLGDLEIIARSDAAGHRLNANNDYFGIDSSLSGEDAEAFDVGEGMWLSFSKDVRINSIDFNLFDDTESFQWIIGTQTNQFDYADLANKTTDEYNISGGIELAADETAFLRTASGSIGLDGLDLEVIPEPVTASFITAFGLGMLVVRRLFQN